MAKKKAGLGTRAVLRRIEPGDGGECAGCGREIKFSARERSHRRVICNVYVAALWNRVEHYHAACYEELGRPHGPAV